MHQAAGWKCDVHVRTQVAGDYMDSDEVDEWGDLYGQGKGTDRRTSSEEGEKELVLDGGSSDDEGGTTRRKIRKVSSRSRDLEHETKGSMPRQGSSDLDGEDGGSGRQKRAVKNRDRNTLFQDDPSVSSPAALLAHGPENGEYSSVSDSFVSKSFDELCEKSTVGKRGKKVPCRTPRETNSETKRLECL